MGFQDRIELHFIPAVFAAANRIAAHDGRGVEPMQYRVHRGHAQDVGVAVETVQGAGLQEIPVVATEPVVHAASNLAAIRAFHLAHEFRRGIGEEDVFN
ncbi:MAG: hypothetical protein RKR03_06810 [Candidatus Competibacter sp.]|nr:hypothetical protein [Candidatus Competibacter sp.]